MSSQNFFNVAHVTSLYERFRSPEVDGPAVITLTGELVERRAKQWRVKPRAELTGLESVLLRFDDVRRNRVLLDTLELTLADPWPAKANELEQTFHGKLTPVPPGPSASTARAVVIRHNQSASLLAGNVRFELEPDSYKSPKDEELSVIRIVLRRFFPD